MTAAAFPTLVSAQSFYFQPEVTARGEYHTNRNLSPVEEDEESIAGYRASLVGLFGYRGPTGELRLRPQVDFQRYPGRRDLQRSEQFFDLRANRTLQRSELSLRGGFSRRDTYTAELVDAEFDDFDDLDPVDGGVGESGRIIGANTRTRVRLRPQYAYRLTERTTGGVGIEYELRRFDNEIGRQQVDYDYLEGGALISHDLDPLTRFTVSPYFSRYETRDSVNRTDSYGAAAGWSRQWTETFRFGVSGSVERAEIGIHNGGDPIEETSTHFGLELSGRLEGLISSARFSIERAYHPTSGGNRNLIHQVRAQYDRELHPRASFRTAARAFRTRPQGGIRGGNDRDYARLDLSLRWELSRTWFVRGGYNFIWQEFAREERGAVNNTVYLDFGFRGLGPPD